MTSWILPKQLISAFALATEELTSDSVERSLICERLLMRRSRRSPAKTYLREWKVGNLTRLQSGLISNPSRGERFLDEWTSSLAVTPANLSQPQENDSAQTIPATSGHSLQMEFGFFDPASASLKMSRDTSVSDCEKSLESWNKWVTRCRGEYSVRVKLAHLTNASECSSWPTANARDWKDSITGTHPPSRPNLSEQTLGQAVSVAHGHPAPVNLSTDGSRLESWLTPRSNEPTEDSNFVARNADRGDHCHSSLTTQAKAWETPTVSTGGHRQADGSMTPKLDQQVKSWATPQQRDFKDPESLAKWTARAEEQKAKEVNLHLPLPSQVMHNEEKANWPTPNCMDTLPPKSQEALDRNREKGGYSNLREWVHHEGTFQMPQTESVWPTPEAYVVRGPIPTEFVDGKFVSLHGEVKYGAKIADAVRVMESWATPRAGCPGSQAPGTGGKVLEEQVKGDNWATPQSRDAKGAEGRMIREGKLAGLPSQTEVAPTGQWNRANGKLNPRWVETLMGLPVGWTMPSCASPVTIAPTNCACSATELCQQPQL